MACRFRPRRCKPLPMAVHVREAAETVCLYTNVSWRSYVSYRLVVRNGYTNVCSSYALLPATVRSGGCVILARKFSVRNFWHDVRRTRANMLFYIGEMVRYLVQAPPDLVHPDETKTHGMEIIYGLGKSTTSHLLQAIIADYVYSKLSFALSSPLWNKGTLT